MVSKEEIQNNNLVQINEQLRANLVNKTAGIEIGDYIRLSYRIVEGDKERIQNFEGVVIARSGSEKNLNATMTLRRSNLGYSVERVFPCFSPKIEAIEKLKKAKVRRAKLYFLRDLKGKKARLKERI